MKQMSQEEIAKHLEKMFVSQYEINSDGSISVHENTYVFKDACFDGVIEPGEPEYVILPFRFKDIKGAFDISDTHLKSFEGCPEIVTGEFRARNMPILTSLKHAPKQIGGDAIMTNNKLITSLLGVQDDLPEVNGKIHMNFDLIKKGGIGLMLIKGLTGISAGARQMTTLPAPFEIISKYIGRPAEDMFDCQEELIAAGFEAFAEL